MAQQYYTREIGTGYRDVYGTAEGYKSVPFLKHSLVDSNYRVFSWVFRNGNTGESTYRFKAGGMFEGEIYPEAPDTAGAASVSPNISSYARPVYQRSYSKFKDAVYEQSELLASIAERRDSFGMIAKRAIQLSRAAGALRKGKLGKFLEVLEITLNPKDKGRKYVRPKQFASYWLEYWMGWAPLANDIYSSADILGSEPPSSVVVRVRSTDHFERQQTQKRSGAFISSRWFGTVSCALSGKVEVTNPTLFKLNQLGLANPLATAWQLIPFSFIADWFLNLGNVLAQVTDWLGLKLSSLAVSFKTVATASWICTSAKRLYGPASPDTVWRERDTSFYSRKVNLRTLPTIQPTIRIPNGLSLTRGLTSLSLLVGLLR